MDGFQGEVKKSLQFKLSAWLALVISGVALAAGVFSFGAAFQEANELQDDQLRQIAILANRQQLQPSPKDEAANAAEADPESRVILQVLQASGTLALKPNDTTLDLPANLPDGIQTVTVKDQTWRLFVRPLDTGARIVTGQQTSVRNEIARNSALRTLLPLVILIPILLILVSELIRQMFKPVKQLALDFDQRAQEDLREVSDAHVPSEIRPFVVAINRLLSRVTQSMALQRRFVADAAHELRSPLTALSLQSERLAAADMSAQARERLGALQSGLQRSRQLLDQLLALARAQETDKGQLVKVSVRRVYHQVLEDLMPLAEAKNIDLGIVGEKDANVLAQEMDLKILVKNLVDNAIRYTPSGGKIDLHIRRFKGRTILQVEDSGVGIPEHERDRVFDPFYRILGNDEVGSGLGLSIVKTIADRLGAVVTLHYVNEKYKTGLNVAVEFPEKVDPASDMH